LNLTATVYHDESVAKCQRGDKLGYTELYHKYSRAMFNTSLRIVNNQADAEDVLQDAFTSAFQSIQAFDYSSSFGAWLKRIVINRSIDHLRRKKAVIVDIEDVVVQHAEPEQYDEELVQLKVETVKKAVSLLPNGYRTVLTLHLFEGYDHEEIAEILKVAQVTVRTQYHRARQKLLDLITKEA
jgi:RNA polymerase sigma-70 factor (ECF subfamily)